MCDNNMDEMIEKEWTYEDCRVAKYSWGFRVWASGGHCDVVPGNGDDMDACEAALDNGESPIASGWEDGAGHDVAAECERTCDIETGASLMHRFDNKGFIGFLPRELRRVPSGPW